MSDVRRTTARSALSAAMPLLLMVLGVWIAWTGPFPWVHAGNRVPIDIYLVGIIQGALVSLVTLGIVIVYRANRIINFAAADIGAAPASFALLLWGALGWNLYLAMGIGFVSAILLGVIVEFLVIRPFFNAPRLILMVVTIVLTELLSALALYLPQWFGSPDKVQYDPIIDVHFHLGKLVTFDGNDVMVLIVVPIVLIALAAFFRFSAIGVALRASAESADRASLLGIPVKRLQSVVWALAALLAFIAVWLRIGVGGEVLGRYLDPAVLLTALGAAVIGRMERMPTAVLAAIGFGIVDQAATFHFNALGVQDVAVVAAIVLIALLLQRADPISRLASAASSTWQATREIRRVPAELRKERPVRAAYAAAALLLIAFLVAIPLWLPGDKLQLASVIAIYGIIGLSLVVLTGWSGQVSLGQTGFVGLAGAVAGTLANRWHWDIALILLASGAFGALAMIIIGLPTLRARGLTFAVATLAFSLAVSTYLLNSGYSPIQSWIPSGNVERTHFLGLFSVDTDTKFYVLTLIILAACILMLRSLRSSRIGRVLIGVRDNERVAQAYSVNARGALAMAFGISGFLAGVAGALFVLQQQSLDAGNFDPTQGLLVFSMAVIGGVGSIGGAVLGAVYLKGLQYFLTQPELALLTTGAGVLIVLYIFKGGLGAAVGDARDAGLRWYARRKGIRVPSLVADTRVETNLPKGEELDIAAALTDAAERGETLVEVNE